VIPGKQYTPELVLAIAWRRKWLIVIPVVLIVAGSFVWARSLPDVYLSDTLILVVPQKVPENYVKSTVTTDIGARLRSIDQEVRSRTRLESIIEEFNLFPERRKTAVMQDLVDELNNHIGVNLQAGGDSFRVSFVSEDPQIAKKVAERLASFFVDASLKDRAVQAEGTSMFLEVEVDDAKRKLLETEEKLKEYRRAHNGELPNQVDANMQGMQNTQVQLMALRNDLDRERDRLGDLQRSIGELTAAAEAAIAAESAGTSRPPDSAAPTAGQLAQAEEVLRQMLLQKTPDHPDVRSQRSQIAKLQKQVDEEQAANTTLGAPADVVVTNPRVKALEDAQYAIKRLERSIEDGVAQEKSLVARIGEYQRRIETAPARDNELIELMRDYSTLQTQYNSLLTKRLESKMSENLERSQRGEQFRILDPARVPERPFYPNRPRMYLMGLLIAIGVGLGLAAVAEYLDRSLRSEDDVRLTLALPVLATIPVIEPAPRESRRSLFGSAAGILAAALGALPWYGLR
jgi:polysaccharide chain length determinant protein (PEP-CTERM system associated)